MSKITLQCEICGKDVERQPSQHLNHVFCCREHFQIWNRKRVAQYNAQENPMNQPRTSCPEREQIEKRSREELSEVRRTAAMKRNGGKYKHNTYKKRLGRHEHRIVAEEILGRPLKKGEVVHHINGNRQDNRRENLMVFQSQSEHTRWHMEHGEVGD